MPFLDQLEVVEASRARDRSVAGRFRSRLAGAIGVQIDLAVAERDGRPLTLTKKRWRRTGPEGAKVLTEVPLRVRPWWWRDEAGRIFLSLQKGAAALELAPGKSAIEVNNLECLPDTLHTLRKAVAAGELDRHAQTLGTSKGKSIKGKAAVSKQPTISKA